MVKRVMPRFSSKRPINSIKKVIDASGATVAGTVSVIPLVNVTAGAAWVDAGNVDVPIGCTISSVFLSVFVYLDQTVGVNAPIIDWYIAKNPGTNLTLPSPGATGASDNRRWILHEEKGLSSDVTDGGTPMVFKGVIKIPRGRTRFGADDQLVIRLLTPSHQAFFCIKCIYKFYR